MTRIAITGVSGRMGRAVLAAVVEDPTTQPIAALARKGAGLLGSDAGMLIGPGPLGLAVTDDLGAALRMADVIVDFTSPEFALEVAEAAREAGKPAVIGTTGLDPSAAGWIAAAAKSVPIVSAPNMSVGVNVLLGLCERTARTLGSGFDVEVVEIHHRKKKDAPSGTALGLARAVARGFDRPADDCLRLSREGMIGPRGDSEIGVVAVRGGDVIGEHTVHFLGLGERIELVHRATSRDTFARGAVRAACWLIGRTPALYDMQDVLGLRAIVPG